MDSIWLPGRNENLLVSKSSNAKSVIPTLTSIFKASKTARQSPVGKKETLNLTYIYIYIYIHMKEFLLIPVDFVARIGAARMARTPTFLARFSHDSVRPRSYEDKYKNQKLYRGPREYPQSSLLYVYFVRTCYICILLEKARMVDCVYSRVPRMPIYTKPQQLLLDGPMERTNDLILERPCSGSGWCLRIVGAILPKRELFGNYFWEFSGIGDKHLDPTECQTNATRRANASLSCALLFLGGE